MRNTEQTNNMTPDKHTELYLAGAHKYTASV